LRLVSVALASCFGVSTMLNAAPGPVQSPSGASSEILQIQEPMDTRSDSVECHSQNLDLLSRAANPHSWISLFKLFSNDWGFDKSTTRTGDAPKSCTGRWEVRCKNVQSPLDLDQGVNPTDCTISIPYFSCNRCGWKNNDPITEDQMTACNLILLNLPIQDPQLGPNALIMYCGTIHELQHVWDFNRDPNITLCETEQNAWYKTLACIARYCKELGICAQDEVKSFDDLAQRAYDMSLCACTSLPIRPESCKKCYDQCTGLFSNSYERCKCRHLQENYCRELPWHRQVASPPPRP